MLTKKMTFIGGSLHGQQKTFKASTRFYEHSVPHTRAQFDLQGEVTKTKYRNEVYQPMLGRFFKHSKLSEQEALDMILDAALAHLTEIPKKAVFVGDAHKLTEAS